MNVIKTSIPDLLIIEPKVFGDPRGFFIETWNQKRYAELGIVPGFVQDNLSLSQRGVLRGLHLQNPHPQGKLVYVLQGEVWDVAVDVRRGSPTFGKWIGETLSSENKRQMWVPPGFAHGFCVLSETALFAYKCTDFYHPSCEVAVQWNDPALGIEWPIKNPTLSAKDQSGIPLAQLSADKLPVYQP